jgi:DNA processing protein
MTPNATQALSARERLDWLRLSRCENVGPVTFRQLLARYGSAERALAALPELARRGGRRRAIRLCPKGEAEAEVAALAEFGGELVAACEPGYPRALAAIDDAPPLLACRGHLHLLEKPVVALVGARNASINGRKFANRLARDLGAAGFVVASGMARGIDTAAHAGALDSGTVAVLAGGVDVVYPAENAGLYEELAARGLLISEMPLGVEPQARHFPRRNRIIAGLSYGVVVVEAALRSGSLITARLAGEQGREVFAVPGSPLDPRARGCNELLRQGAVLVESATDVLRELAGRSLPAREPAADEFVPARLDDLDEAALDRARHLVVEALGPSPVAVDELVRECQLSPAVVSLVLLELELAGRLERHPGGRVALLAECD